MDYAEDVDSAVETLTRGAEFAEAYRIVSFRGNIREKVRAPS